MTYMNISQWTPCFCVCVHKSHVHRLGPAKTPSITGYQAMPQIHRYSRFVKGFLGKSPQVFQKEAAKQLMGKHQILGIWMYANGCIHLHVSNIDWKINSKVMQDQNEPLAIHG